MKQYTLRLDPAEKTLFQNILILLRELFDLAPGEQLDQLLWKVQTAEEERG